MSRIKFMNIELDNLTMEESIDRIDYLVRENKNAYAVFTWMRGLGIEFVWFTAIQCISVWTSWFISVLGVLLVSFAACVGFVVL